MKNKGFTTANEKQNKNKFLFYSSAVGEKTRSGFTLIELLVVISIISLLSSVVLASLQDARTKAQVTAFKQYGLQLINAIELYRLDNNGGIPADISVLISGGYIGSQEKPLFTTIYSIENDLLDEGISYTCGGVSSEYWLAFQSSVADLDFNRMYADSSPYDNGDGNIFYCLSPTIR